MGAATRRVGLPAKQARAAQVFERLDRAMPEAKIELDYRSDLELLTSSNSCVPSRWPNDEYSLVKRL